MNDEPTFDPRRKAAIRDLVVQNAAAHPGRAGRRKRTAMVVTLVLLAVSISGGTVAYALGTGLLDPTPAAAPTPTVTPTPTTTPTSTPTPTPATADRLGRDHAIDACMILDRMFQVDGASEEETKANARERGAEVVAEATAARSADPRWNDVADAVTAAQSSLIDYLDENTPSGILALETAAADAQMVCAPLGVTVQLQEG